MFSDPIDRQRLNKLVDALTEEDDLWRAACDIASELFDGKQDVDNLMCEVVIAINVKFGWQETD